MFNRWWGWHLLKLNNRCLIKILFSWIFSLFSFSHVLRSLLLRLLFDRQIKFLLPSWKKIWKYNTRLHQLCLLISFLLWSFRSSLWVIFCRLIQMILNQIFIMRRVTWKTWNERLFVSIEIVSSTLGSFLTFLSSRCVFLHFKSLIWVLHLCLKFRKFLKHSLFYLLFKIPFRVTLRRSNHDMLRLLRFNGVGMLDLDFVCQRSSFIRLIVS